MIFKKIPILIVLCVTASILVILFYLLGYNVLTVPPKTSEQLLEAHLQIDNVSSEENIDENGLVSVLLRAITILNLHFLDTPTPPTAMLIQQVHL